MVATQYDILIEQGATFEAQMTYKDSAGTGINLIGYQIRMQARAKHSDTATVLDLSTATSGITLTDAANGVFSLNLSANETAALTANQFLVYDIEIESPAGVVTRLTQGNITISPEVTR